jgi:hypothetical protein
MIRAILAISFYLIAILFFVGEIQAQTYSSGYVDQIDQTVFHNGYWFYLSDTTYANPYSRVKYQYPVRYINGCAYPGNFYYQYTRVYLPSATPTVKSENWRNELLKIAGERDKINGKAQLEILEHTQYMEAVKSLGLAAPIPSPGYVIGGSYGGYSGAIGIAPGYSMSGQYYSYPLVPTASTIYGYGYNAISSFYKDTDLNQLYLQAAQLTAGAQKLAGDANSQFGSLVSQEGSNKARVAEILAKGQVVSQMLQALQNNPIPEAKGFSFTVQPGGILKKDDSKVEPSVKEKLQTQLADLLASKCSNCHYGKTTKGSWSIESYFSSTQDEKQKRIWPRILSQDQKFLMPRNADGSAGTPLTDVERQLFLLN